MRGANGPDAVEEFHARVEAAVAGTAFRMQRKGPGFDLAVNVDARPRQVHTYRVALRLPEKAFTMTDIIRTVENEGGPGGPRLGRSVSAGRSVYVVTRRSLDGTDRYRFSSADGHRLIRGVAKELGWREIRPTSVKVAIGLGIFGAVVALGTLIALAAVFWL
ncbi:hypothetical protein ABZ079_00820 [Streptomyces sp. NPDC006314]|uniref:hypothetical protein n=1 Tax=Streptomyces sp. NPDC006314 TaxID=3154475 RepID=UPI0033B27A31